jgi:hypothetical protein
VVYQDAVEEVKRTFMGQQQQQLALSETLRLTFFPILVLD